MSRFSRKSRTDIKIKTSGGLLDLLDNAIKEAWYINDDEFDFICEVATDEELALLANDDMSISEIKVALRFIDNTLEKFYDKKS